MVEGRRYDNSISDNPMSDDSISDIRQSNHQKSEIEQSEIGNRTAGLSEIDFAKINIEELLPQRKPFIAIDRMVHFDKVFTVTGFKIVEQCIFVENGFLTEAGVIENIAQTCAARMGYINKHLHSDKVKIGFIGSVKNLVIEELPRVGDELTTTIEVFSEVFAITLVNAKVEVAEKLIASCEMKIAITDNDMIENE